jgi:hypothetical protein
MGWSFLPNALRPFKMYCAPPTIISQLVLFLWQTVEIDPLGLVRVVETLQNFVWQGGGIIYVVTSHFKNSIKAILHISTKFYKYIKVINDIKEWIRSPWTQDVCFYLSLIEYHTFCFVNVLFIFIPMFHLMLILLKNNLNGSKNNFGTAILI